MDGVLSRIIAVDFDGTLLDSNDVKYRAVLKAQMGAGLSKVDAEHYAEQFIKQSGISRETKLIGEYGPSLGTAIVERYNALLQVAFDGTVLPALSQKFLGMCTNIQISPMIVSGSKRSEIVGIVRRSRLPSMPIIYGDQDDKSSTLLELDARCLVGDSVVDLLAAQQIGIPFVFVSELSWDKENVRMKMSKIDVEFSSLIDSVGFLEGVCR